MSWGELVTTALLGTTRRPLADLDEAWATPPRDEVDPAVRLLDLAAAHRVLELLGDEPGIAQDPQTAPEQHHPVAPAAAVQLFDELCARPEPTMISFWLRQCVAHHRTVAPVHWTFIARAAARTTRYDRALVGRAMGEAGRWFLRQNPDWRRLAADATAGALTPPPPPTRPGTSRRSPVFTVDELVADPELLFAQPDPWPTDLVAGAWAVIGSARLGPRLVSYATEVGLRMPAELYPRLPDAARFYLEAPDASPAERRAIRYGFAALEDAAFGRAQIVAAFAEGPTTFDRVEIPRV